jgi:hypothetical protein
MPSIPTFMTIPNTGPLQCVFEPVVAGSSVDWSIFFEDETSPGVWQPMSFAGFTLVAELRESVYDASPISSGITAVVSATPGEIDFLIPAAITAARPDTELQFGFKMVPGDPSQAKVFAMGVIPVLRAGVR